MPERAQRADAADDAAAQELEQLRAHRAMMQWGTNIKCPFDVAGAILRWLSLADPHTAQLRRKMADLCNDMMCDRTTVSRMLAYLEDVGVLSRQTKRGGPGQEQVLQFHTETDPRLLSRAIRIKRHHTQHHYTPQDLHAQAAAELAAEAENHGNVATVPGANYGDVATPNQGKVATVSGPNRGRTATVSPEPLQGRHSSDDKLLQPTYATSPQLGQTVATNLRNVATVQSEQSLRDPIPPKGGIAPLTPVSLSEGLTSSIGLAKASPGGGQNSEKSVENSPKSARPEAPHIHQLRLALKALGYEPVISKPDGIAFSTAWGQREDKDQLVQLVARCWHDTARGVYGQGWLANNLNVRSILNRLQSYESWLEHGQPGPQAAVTRNGSSGHSGRPPASRAELDQMREFMKGTHHA